MVKYDLMFSLNLELNWSKKIDIDILFSIYNLIWGRLISIYSVQ